MATGPVVRPVSAKRVTRLRLNWFVIGSVFGVGISFFMNLMITAVVIPEYKEVMARHGEVLVAEADKQPAKPAEGPLAPLPVAAAAPAPPAPAAPTYPRTLAVELGRGETLLAMLIRQQVAPGEARQVVDALDDKINPKSLKAGQKISLTLARNETLGDKASVKELAIRLPNLSAIELSALQQGGYNVAATTETLTQQPYRAFGKVRSSFSQAASDAGIPAPVMNELIAAYSYDVDFQRDIHPGDTIEVLIDRKVSKDGRVGGYGGARYAALMLGRKKVEIYKFKDGSGDVAWFDGAGNAVKNRCCARRSTGRASPPASACASIRCWATASSTRASISAPRKARRSSPPATARSNTAAGRTATAISCCSSTTTPTRPPTPTARASPPAWASAAA
ncbi:MAG: hypothetical protein WDN72_02175 [Alphaproteobacteria bacterium]